ncbi:MAG: chemotaxis response regulator protein-glutamate methylesterase [Bacteroidales bacterium]|nr:chemotaxis response regulator protein-glutamate methylesterase [Bacteroidales bacterium]
MKKIKVMIIDDSALVRQTLAGILNTDPAIQVIATAADPIFAARKIVKEPPDVITLDLEMPRMNGLTFLKKLMSQFPIPVIIISSLTAKSAELTIKALEYGAMDIVSKPELATQEFFEESQIRICDAVKAAAVAKINRKKINLEKPVLSPKYSADHVLSLSKSNSSTTIKETTDKVIAVGASTGGTDAIQLFLETMPPDCPGIVIVQHMPEFFTKSFADRLNSICRITVKEGKDGEIITPGKAVIAPGNKHLLLRRTGAKYCVEVNDGPLVNRHRPSVDVLFRSAAKFAGQNAAGIIMTGMGDDGAKGLFEMNQTGAYTIAQDEKSCIVFGMPKAAINLKAVDIVLPLEKIPDHVYQKLTGKRIGYQ